MRNHSFFLLTFVTLLCFSGCKRDYKVIYARPVVDSTALETQQQQEGESLDASDSISAPLDEPLIDIPDMPDEVDFSNTDGKEEYENFIHGR